MSRFRDRLHSGMPQPSFNGNRIETFPNCIEPADGLYAVLSARLLFHRRRHREEPLSRPGRTLSRARYRRIRPARRGGCSASQTIDPAIAAAWISVSATRRVHHRAIGGIHGETSGQDCCCREWTHRTRRADGCTPGRSPQGSTVNRRAQRPNGTELAPPTDQPGPSRHRPIARAPANATRVPAGDRRGVSAARPRSLPIVEARPRLGFPLRASASSCPSEKISSA